MSLQTPESIRKLQKALYVKAKRCPEQRFHALYDKVYRWDVLEHSWRKCRAKRGKPGVDGVSFEDIEKQGVEEWLKGLQEEVRDKRYKPAPVRRVMIPKNGGTGERPLGIPTIRDRVVQRAAVIVLEPIFEAGFDDAAHGYRPGRSSFDAVEEVHMALRDRQTQVVDGDLSKYFDTIPHDLLMECIRQRVSDGAMLHLIKMWLKTPVEIADKRGRKQYSGGKKSKVGTPQGGVISPLLANIYMHRYIRAFRKYELDKKHQAKLVNYADDFVVLCRKNADQVYEKTDEWMTKLGLTLNTQKSRVVNAWDEGFNFLGYTFGVLYAKKTHRRYLGATPSKKAVMSLQEKIRKKLKPRDNRPISEVVGSLNRTLRGWGNYFSYGTVNEVRKSVDHYVIQKMRYFLRRRHKVQGRGTRRFTYDVIRNQLGVISVAALPQRRSAHA